MGGGGGGGGHEIRPIRMRYLPGNVVVTARSIIACERRRILSPLFFGGENLDSRKYVCVRRLGQSRAHQKLTSSGANQVLTARQTRRLERAM